MADVNTEKSKAGFIFGQNMEDRAIKPNDEAIQDPNEENGEPTGVSSTTGTALLRPSAFGSGASGVIAPSRFQASANPWMSQNPDSTEAAVSSTDSASGISSSNQLVSSSNPFAERVSQGSVSAPGSDSEAEERKDKPVVAPSHFKSSRPVCAPPKFAAAHAPSPSKCLLRPSALDKQTVHFKSTTEFGESNSKLKTSFKLEPAKLQSPLSVNKGDSNKENEKSSSEVDTTKPGMSEEASKRLFGEVSTDSQSQTEPSQNTAENKQASSDGASTENSSLFVFGQNMEKRVTAVSSSSNPATGAAAFVFGQKLEDRVERAETDATNNEPHSSPPPATSPSSAAEKAGSPTARTLEESAAEEQAKLAKPSYDEVEVKTGEENESNVFQLNAKLYAFDKPRQNWCEKGRGALRLNDMSSHHDSAAFQSRLVMRAQGSLRVILNTKIWAAQTIERANPRSVKVSAWDCEENAVKVFLIQANPKDADQIFSAIDWRIQQLKVEEHNKSASATEDQEAETAKKDKPLQKRRRDGEEITPPKKQRVEGEQRKLQHAEESNDSSTVDPETEASNESFASSPTVKSTSSDN